MCFSCALRQRALFANDQWAGAATDATVHYGTASAVPGQAFLLAGAPGDTAGLIVIGDDVPGDRSTTATLAVGAPETVSTIETIGDQDFYRVELQAGRAYEFGMFAKLGGPNLIPLGDSYLELYDAAGTLIASADGGASTTINTANSGFDAILTFEATASGVYYVNARAFDNATQDGPDGDMIGDYALSARDVTDAPRYIPYYDAQSPLYALDWGTQVDGTVRNPDGAESGHVTGNPAGTADDKGADITGKNVIKIYFAKAGDLFISEDLTQPNLPPATVAVGAKDFEVAAVWASLREFEKVADIVYVETQVREEADFEYFTYTGTPGPGVSLLGSMAPPQENDEGLALFNSGDERWNATNLAQGGFSFVTLIHEFGHGHGMAHPHDNGGYSGIMRGVVAEGAGIADYTTGDFGLNQAVHTMMSYEDGWPESPHGNAPTNVGYGYLGGLMAFDIAVIQDKYGVNEEWATGDDTYTLKDVNAAGTFYYSIWDAGGTDQIVYDGARNTTVDLRAATLEYEVGGGGRVSFASGIFGGFTIANGVVIENARTGSGDDTLIGNAAANVLIAGAGADTVDGGAGDDAIYGAAGKDTLTGDAGRDQFLYAELTDSGVGLTRDVITDFTAGVDRIALDQLGAKSFIGSGAFTGVAGQVSATVANGVTVVRLDANGDRAVDLEIELTGAVSLDRDDFVLVETNDVLVGTKGNDTLRGFGGDDTLTGLAGNDLLDGGAGSDTADFSANKTASTIDLALTGAQNTGAGNDTLLFVENVIGGLGADKLYGNADANTLDGRRGNDRLEGRAGNDVLIGGIGLDTLIGGDGADRFVYAAIEDSALATRDQILDFTSGVDSIDLAAIDANTLAAGDQTFSFIGAAAFTKAAGELRVVTSGSRTELMGDVNGDGKADFSILLMNKAVPLSGDLIL